MEKLKDLLPLVLLASTYVLFAKMKGFEGQIQKLLKLKGMKNLIVQSIVFVIFVILSQYMYYQVIGEDVYEGQDDVDMGEEDMSEEVMGEEVMGEEVMGEEDMGGMGEEDMGGMGEEDMGGMGEEDMGEGL